MFTTFWLEYQLWGLHAGGYHMLNVLLHAANAVLVWRLLRRMGFGGAFVTALIFALHPVHVESVAWITERKNVLSAVFYLLSVGSYLRFEAGGRWRWYAVALLFFLTGLLAKTVICTMPLALWLLRWWRRERIGARHVLFLVPFVAVGGVMGTVTAIYEHHQVLHGASGAHWALSMPERFIVAGRALWFYAGKLLWPSPLVFNYPRWPIDATDAVHWIWPLSAILAAIILWILGRARDRGLSTAGWFTVITLSPALGFVNVAPMRFSFVADHFVYLASLGVIAALVGLAGLLIKRATAFRVGAGARRGAYVLATTVVAAALAAITFRQALLYRHVEDLWRHTIRHNPDSWLARGNLGVLLRQRGDFDAARQQFEYMLERCVPWPEPQAQAHTNLGHIDRQEGRYPDAIRHYELALAAMPNKHEARFGLGQTYDALGFHERAAGQYRLYLKDNPNDARAHVNLALTLQADSQFAEAETSYVQALRLDPRLLLAHIGLARLCVQLGRFDQAASHYCDAVQISPHDSQLRILAAGALAQAGRRDEAMNLLREGVRLDPASSEQLESALSAIQDRPEPKEAED